LSNALGIWSLGISSKVSTLLDKIDSLGLSMGDFALPKAGPFIGVKYRLSSIFFLVNALAAGEPSPTIGPLSYVCEICFLP